MMMTPRALLIRRSHYSYPAVGLHDALGTPKHIQFRSTFELDAYHGQCLSSSQSTKLVNGYLSVVYWGHYSGQNGVVHPERALAKVTMAKNVFLAENGLINIEHAACIIRSARRMLRRGEAALAISALAHLPQLGFAFASKLCAFLSPEQCGVIDSVIARKHPHFGFSVDVKGIVRRNIDNAIRYEHFCRFLIKKASDLNSLGFSFMWRDRLRRHHSWRAIDVERALY